MSRLAAYHYRGPKIDTLRIERITDGRRTFIHEEYVTDRADARRRAKALGAEPWNF